MSTPVGVGSGEDIQELLNKAQRLLDRIRSKMQKLVDKINGILQSIPSFLVPDFIVDKIKTGIRKMDEVFTKLVSKVQEFFASPGWPPALFEAGDRWLAQVAQPSAMSEAEVSASRLHVDDYWKGSAADAYKDTLGEQQPAFAAMAALARKVKEFLHTAAWGIIKFWIAVGLALAGVAVAIIAAIVACSSVVGAPAAPLAVVAGIGAALVTITSVAWAVFVEFQGIKQAASSVREERQFNTDFDGNNWPAATAAGEWKAD
ncbi:MAG: hypothetical protein ACRDTA_12400 [Pseudonocardiaceae bacterium]